MESASHGGSGFPLRAQPIATRASLFERWAMMGKIGLSMMFYDKSKLLGTLFGVIFAVVLSNQQVGTFLGLLHKNVMLIDNAGAQLWVVPQASESLLSATGQTVNTSALYRARTTPGVAWAEPILIVMGAIRLPDGGTQQIQIIGTRLPDCKGGPWNVVAGSCKDLMGPDTIIVEDGERRTLGGLNLGSVREINRRSMTVVGFTWGLVPFGPSYAFTDFETARELGGMASDQVSFVLVGLEAGANIREVQRALAQDLTSGRAVTQAEYKEDTVRELLTRTPIGITFGTSTAFGLIVGLVIVALSMYSSVVDNVREFGTLKAIGCTNFDLALLLFVQSITFAILGSMVGLALVTRIAGAIRSAKLTILQPSWLVLGTLGLMLVLCTLASMLALLRVRKVEPAMVFR